MLHSLPSQARYKCPPPPLIAPPSPMRSGMATSTTDLSHSSIVCLLSETKMIQIMVGEAAVQRPGRHEAQSLEEQVAASSRRALPPKAGAPAAACEGEIFGLTVAFARCAPQCRRGSVPPFHASRIRVLGPSEGYLSPKTRGCCTVWGGGLRGFVSTKVVTDGAACLLENEAQRLLSFRALPLTPLPQHSGFCASLFSCPVAGDMSHRPPHEQKSGKQTGIDSKGMVTKLLHPPVGFPIETK